MKTNFEGPSLFLGEIANFFEERGYGSIIGISSVAGDRGRASNYIYGSAKAGFSAFLSGLRNRLHKSKIKVLTIRPGFVRTKMTRDLNLPNLITAKPKDVANYIYKVRNKSINKALFPWNYIMFIIKNIPEILFKNLNL